MAIFEVHHLSKRFGNLEVLKDISLTINPGEIVLDHFTGASGASKMTVYDSFSLGGEGSPPVILGNNTMIEAYDVQPQYRAIRSVGPTAKLCIMNGGRSPEGQQLIDRSVNTFRQINAEMFEGISDEELRCLTGLLDRIHTHWNNIESVEREA